MKVAGIIAEFNPFHNGHEYIISQAKQITEADFVVVVMSGDFVQSGKPAFCAKELRTEMALSCGADLVLMLPCAVSTGSAEIFAEGAVALLDSLGCVDYVCFGSEICDIKLLGELAGILADEPYEYRIALRKNLSTGMSFPAAREAAVVEYLSESTNTTMRTAASTSASAPNNKDFLLSDADRIHEALSSSNSILAIEYLKALRKLRSNMTLVAVPRKTTGHLSHKLSAGENICSATALRNFISVDSPDEQLYSTVKCYVPNKIYPLYEEHLKKDFPVTEEALTSWLTHSLLNAKEKTLSEISDCDDGLAHSLLAPLYKLGDSTLSYKSIIDALATKNYTRNRISRTLIHYLLGITTADMQNLKTYNYCLYARILGFRAESTPLLHTIKDCVNVPLISKLSDAGTTINSFYDTPSARKCALKSINLDILAGNQYSLLQKELYNTPILHETRKNIVKL